ncbi:mCG144951, partial [Mus musculus]
LGVWVRVIALQIRTRVMLIVHIRCSCHAQCYSVSGFHPVKRHHDNDNSYTGKHFVTRNQTEAILHKTSIFNRSQRWTGDVLPSHWFPMGNTWYIQCVYSFV